MADNTYLEIKAMAGAYIKKVCEEMIALSRRLDIQVRCNANRVCIIANPNSDPARLFASYEEEASLPDSAIRVAVDRG